MPSRLGNQKKIGPRLRGGFFFSQPKFLRTIRSATGVRYVRRWNPVKAQRTFNKAIKRYAPRNSIAYRRARAIARRNKTLLTGYRATGTMPRSAGRSFVGW